MNEIIRDVYVLRKEIQEPIELAQGSEVSVIFRFSDYNIPDGATGSVIATKPSKKQQLDEVTIIGNDVKFNITSQMTAEIGFSEIQVQIRKDNRALYTIVRRMDVKKSLYPIESGTGSSIIDKYLDDIKEATEEASTATEAADTAAGKANAAAEAADTAAGEANAAAEAADTAAGEANAAAEAADTAAGKANAAAEAADTAAEDIQNKAENGEFTSTITVGTVTTGEPGTNAGVTNRGTEKDAVLDFTIPRGDTGEVENIDTVTVEFEQAAERKNINTGETFATLFGKIKKYFSDLKTVAFTGSYNNLSNTPKIQNNLTTTEEGSVLDATQGKVLDNKKIDKDKIVKSTEISEEGFLMDGKICSEALANLNDNYIVEEGENDNGHYRKWSNGTLEMWGGYRGTFSIPSGNVQGNIYYSANRTIPFPIESKTSARIVATVYSNGIQWLKISTSNTNKTGFDVVIMQPTGANPTANVNWSAIGTWK